MALNPNHDPRVSITGIVSDPDINAGQPTLKEGYTVIQVVRLIEKGLGKQKAADVLGIPPHRVNEALRYYRLNVDSIEQIRNQELAVVKEHRVPPQAHE